MDPTELAGKPLLSTHRLLQIIAVSVGTLAVIAVALALEYTYSIMIPFVFAIFLSLLVTPLIKWMRVKLRLRHWMALTITMLVVMACMSLVGVTLVTMLRAVVESVDLYRERIIVIVAHGLTFLQNLGIGIEEQSVLQQISGLPLFAYLTTAAGKVANLFTNITLILIFLLFLLLGREVMKQRDSFFEEVAEKIRRYLLVKLVISAVTSTLVGAILYLFGLEMALVFAVATFILNFIPTLGSIIATLLPIPIALIQFENPWTIAAVILVPGAIQFLIGNVIDPKLMGDRLDLHPVTVLLVLMFWGLIWGVAGMFLAVPITAVVKIVLVRTRSGFPIAEMMAGRIPGAQR